MSMLELGFWGCFGVIGFTYLGYPVLAWFLGRVVHRPLGNQDSVLRGRESVSAVVVAHNEAGRIGAKVRNLLESAPEGVDYEVVVVSDGSTDGTGDAAREAAAGDSRVVVVDRETRQGKAACLNVGVSTARHDIVVFADARQRFALDTVSLLSAHFQDTSLGAISGSNHIERSGSNVGGGVDAYWKFEKWLRWQESKFDSAIGCTGAIYAIRKSLYRPLPEDTILDDVVIPMEIARQGKRIGFDPAATSYDPQQNEPEREHVRKQRTLAGNYQMMFRYPQWLLPWKNRLWWQLISHKYLRLLAPWAMLGLLVTNAMLLADAPSIYSFTWWSQCGFYLCAGMGLAFRRFKFPLLSIPAAFVFLNWMTFLGLLYFLRDAGTQGWELAHQKQVPRG